MPEQGMRDVTSVAKPREPLDHRRKRAVNNPQSAVRSYIRETELAKYSRHE